MLAFTYFLKAVFIGFAIAAPIGPVGLLCIRETLEQGFIAAVYIGVGATVANALFGFLAGAGFKALSSFLLQEGIVFKMLGGMFLLYLAWREFSSVKKVKKDACSANPGFMQLAPQSFFLVITNPVAILSFISIFASISGHAAASFQEALLMVFGVAVGSMAWWLILGYSVTKVQGYLSPLWVNRIRYVSAAIIAWFGLMALFSVISHMVRA